MTADHTLQFLPIKELETLRTNASRRQELLLKSDEVDLKAGDGVSFELKFKINLEETDADALALDLRCGEGKRIRCTFDFKHAQMSVDRNQSDGWSEGISRSVMYLKGKKELDVHIFSDQSSIEIFTDNYRNNHSNNVFAGKVQNGIKLRACGGRAMLTDVEAYGMCECNR